MGCVYMYVQNLFLGINDIVYNFPWDSLKSHSFQDGTKKYIIFETKI